MSAPTAAATLLRLVSGRCYHSATINGDWLSDETPVRSLCSRMVCTRCGIIGADVRPDSGPHVDKKRMCNYSETRLQQSDQIHVDLCHRPVQNPLRCLLGPRQRHLQPRRRGLIRTDQFNEVEVEHEDLVNAPDRLVTFWCQKDFFAP
jgi:hypothetical protein